MRGTTEAEIYRSLPSIPMRPTFQNASATLPERVSAAQERREMHLQRPLRISTVAPKPQDGPSPHGRIHRNEESSDLPPASTSGAPEQTNGASMPRLRLSLTIPGELSLGVYEGGALAALIVVAKELGEDVLVIDSIAAGSPGSITGLLAARALLEGVDPLKLLASAWVEDASLRAMEADAADPPLLSDALTTVAATLFGPGNTAGVPSSTRQEEPVRLSMALGSLGGPTCDPPRDPLAQSSAPPDWYIITLTNTAMPYEYLAYADAAIAAGSNAIRSPASPREPRTPHSGARRRGFSASPATGCSGTPSEVRWTTRHWTVRSTWPSKSKVTTSGCISSSIPILPSPLGHRPTHAVVTLLFPPSVGAGTHAFGSGHSPWIYEGLERLEGADIQVEWIGTKAPAVDAVGNQPQSDSHDPDVRFRRSLNGAIDECP